MATTATRLAPIVTLALANRNRKLRGTPPAQLSAREEEVVTMVAQGKCTKEIAVALGLATKTVETHRHNIYTKLGVGSAVEMTHYALARGLVGNKFQSEEFYGS